MTTCKPCGANMPRLLIVPGLHDSGPAHWQSWLQVLHRDSVRVEQDDWHTPDLGRWSACIGHTLAVSGPGPWLVAAHSFGVLALAHYMASHWADPVHPLQCQPNAVAPQAEPAPRLLGALMVAPADPAKFGVIQQLSSQPLPGVNLLIGSQTDPWMRIDSAHQWARRWGAHFQNLGDAGHINVDSGHGPLPLARRWLIAMSQRHARQQRLATSAYEEIN